MLRALGLELRVFLELYLLPGLTACLPWPLGFRWLRACSRWPALYRDEWQAALAQARNWVEIPDEALWGRQFRLARLVDHADYWLSLSRTRRWLRRHMDMSTPWPRLEGPAIGIFFHTCPHLWSMRSLREQGVDAAVLAGHFSRRSMGGSHLGHLYGVLRLRELARVSGQPLIFSPGSVRKSQAMLDAGCWVVGTPDVPPTETVLDEAVQLFGRPARFTRGLLLIAERARVPVVVFAMGLDMASGRRQLEVLDCFPAGRSVPVQAIADHWQNLVRKRSWGFMLWQAMPAWFASSSAAAETDEKPVSG